MKLEMEAGRRARGSLWSRERGRRESKRVWREEDCRIGEEVHVLFNKPRAIEWRWPCVIGRRPARDAEQPACARVGCDGRPYQQAAARDLQKEMLLTLLD